MDRQYYIDLLLDHYENPRNRGKLDDADASTSGGNPGCGDIVTMHVKMNGDVVESIRFEGEGCTISQAGASIVAERFEGRPASEIEETGFEEIVDTMGKDVVISRVRCATVGLGTLKAAVQEHHKNQVRAGNV
jgi:nitrogen fixation protein NifU and related proteins